MKDLLIKISCKYLINYIHWRNYDIMIDKIIIDVVLTFFYSY